MTMKILCLGLSVGLTLGCGGSSKSSDGTRAHSGGAAGTGADTSGDRGGAGAEAGSSASLGGRDTSGSGGGAALSGSSSGATGGAASGATGGTSGSAGVGRGGRNQAGTGGGGSAGHTSASGGGAGEETAGGAGMNGAAGSDGTTCGGLAAKMCDPGQWCHWSNGSCGIGDQPGECFSSGGIACAPGAACGCDGHAYTMACRAHANGVDTTSDKTCVPGDGVLGDPCFVDTDCSPTLKCCASPIGLMTCMTAPSGTCPLTP